MVISIIFIFVLTILMISIIFITENKIRGMKKQLTLLIALFLLNSLRAQTDYDVYKIGPEAGLNYAFFDCFSSRVYTFCAALMILLTILNTLKRRSMNLHNLMVQILCKPFRPSPLYWISRPKKPLSRTVLRWFKETTCPNHLHLRSLIPCCRLHRHPHPLHADAGDAQGLGILRRRRTAGRPGLADRVPGVG